MKLPFGEQANEWNVQKPVQSMGVYKIIPSVLQSKYETNYSIKCCALWQYDWYTNYMYSSLCYIRCCSNLILWKVFSLESAFLKTGYWITLTLTRGHCNTTQSRKHAKRGHVNPLKIIFVWLISNLSLKPDIQGYSYHKIKNHVQIQTKQIIV